MKQLGNLALICARRKNVVLSISNGEVTLHIGTGVDQAILLSAWDNDVKISDMIRELNFGKYAEPM